ncbi:MAG: GAF domain-containing protein, partial [Deltaproteobacteria bacterium]
MTNYFAILPIVSATLSVALGLFTLSRNPRQLTNIGFALGMASLAVIEAGNTVILLSYGGGAAGVMGTRTLLIGESLLPSAWILFSLAFARANHREVLSKNALLVAGIIIASLSFAAIWAIASASTPRTIVDAYSGEPLLLISSPLLKYFHIYLILGLVFNLVHLENTLRYSEGPKRWQIKYVIFGVGSILAFFIFTSSQALLYSTLALGNIPVTSSVIIIAVSMMAVFIVRHRLMDVDIFISRYVVYNSLTVIIVGLYLIATGLIANGIRYFNVPFHHIFTTLFVFVSVLALFIIFFTASLKRKFQVFINRHFYKHKYEFRDKWMETIEKISPKRSVEEIWKTLTEMVSSTMGVKEVYVWIYDPASREYSSPTPGLDDKLRKIKNNHPLLALIRERMTPFTLDGRGNGAGPALNGEVNALISSTKAALCAPLIAGPDIVGFLLQGKDFSGEPYRQDDFEILKAMTTQAAVQITNIRLLEDLVNVKEVEAFSNMSSFIMHDL